MGSNYKKQQAIENYKVVHQFMENGTKLNDIRHSKEFLDELYKFVVKYS